MTPGDRDVVSFPTSRGVRNGSLSSLLSYHCLSFDSATDTTCSYQYEGLSRLQSPTVPSS